jgi:hypothetical protein
MADRLPRNDRDVMLSGGAIDIGAAAFDFDYGVHWKQEGIA